MKNQAGILVLLSSMVCVAPMVLATQGNVIKAGDISKSATITAINHTTRVVTLKDAQGHVEDVMCGPEIRRFNELKVGDTVTFSYHAAVVYDVVKSGQQTTAAAGSSVVRGQGVKPSGALTKQMKATVTIDAIDAAAPSVTVRTADGHSITAQVEDKKKLEGLKVGDKVDITFTEALMVTVDAPKK